MDNNFLCINPNNMTVELNARLRRQMYDIFQPIVKNIYVANKLYPSSLILVVCQLMLLIQSYYSGSFH